MAKNFVEDLKKRKRRPAVKFRFSMLVFIFTITLGVFFAMHIIEANINDEEFIRNLYGHDNSSVKNSDINSSGDTNSSNTSRLINPVPQSTDVKGAEYWAECALVGDSTMLKIANTDTKNISKNNVFSASNVNIGNINDVKINQGSGNNTIVNLLQASNLKNIYIMLGNDGIETLSIEQMIESYTTFIRNLKKAMPNAKIYIMSIPPVTEEREKMQTNSVSNLKIDQYNSELLRLANSESVYFIDVNTTLKGNNGKLPNAFAENDNINLKASTYKVIHDYILTHTAD